MKLKHTLLIGGIVLITIQCREPKEPESPCEGKERFEADFQILEEVGDTLIETSVVQEGGRVFFTASGKYESYLWKVGDDDRTWTVNSFPLYFNKVYGDIKVTLIAKYTDYKWCFNDDGIDTIVKVFRVIPEAHVKDKILGTYVGYDESNPADTFSVRIGYDLINQSGDYINEDYIVENLPKGCLVKKKQTTVSIRLGGDSFKANYSYSYPCNVLSMCGRINRDLIVIQYLIWDKSKEIVVGQPIPHFKRYFIGTRKK